MMDSIYILELMSADLSVDCNKSGVRKERNQGDFSVSGGTISELAKTGASDGGNRLGSLQAKRWCAHGACL